MKKLIIISIIIFLHITTLTSNNIFPDSLVIKWAKDDPTLSMILSSIPKNWHFELKDSFLKIFCEDSLICEPKAIESDSIENVYKDKVQPFILLRYEPIWSIEKLVNSRQKNEILYKQIIELQQKYNKKPTKNQNILDKNSTHLDSVYYNKLQVINEKYIEIPDFNTSKYSWFFVDECCVNNEDLKFSPTKISLEMINIKNLFRELGGK